MTEEAKVSTTANIRHDQVVKLRQLSAQTGVPMAEIIRQGVDLVLKKNQLSSFLDKVHRDVLDTIAEELRNQRGWTFGGGSVEYADVVRNVCSEELQLIARLDNEVVVLISVAVDDRRGGA